MKLGSDFKDIKLTGILVFRLFLFVLLLTASFLFVPISSFLLTAFAVYGLVTLCFLLSLVFSRKPWVQKYFGVVTLAQLFLEVLVEALVTNYSGGVHSNLAVLFFLTIVSASLSYQILGTTLIATWASLTYTATVLSAAGWNLDSIFSLKAVSGIYSLGDEYFYTLFIYLCSFYLVAFTSGYLAQRLKIKAELLLTAARQLKRVRMETDDILQYLHSGLVTIDNTGRIVYFNRAAEEILELKSKEVRGKECQLSLGDRLEELTQKLLSALVSGLSQSRQEIEIKNRRGEKVPLGISTSPLTDEEGQVAGVIALFQDLSNIKKLEEKLRLKDRLAAIGELSAGIAHEIRNPLASISGSVEVLKQELSLEGENQNLLDLIIKESQRLNRILTEFLNFARLQETPLARVDLVPLVSEVIELVKKHSSYKSQIEITDLLPIHPVWVWGEENQLKQLFLNLAINAIEAMEEGGQLSFSYQPPDWFDRSGSRQSTPSDWVSIWVTDQGKGMTKEQTKKIFTPFHSTKKQGTGLGLAIVQRLADNLKGRIDYQSIPGQGTTFALSLRMHQPGESNEEGKKLQVEAVNPLSIR